MTIDEADQCFTNKQLVAYQGGKVHLVGINRLNNTVDILTRGHVKNVEVGELKL